MLTKLSHILKRKANYTNIIIVLVAYLILNLLVFPYFINQISEDKKILDLTFGFAPQSAYEILSSYSNNELSAYRNMLLYADLIYPFVYSLLLSFGISLNIKKIIRPGSKLQYLNLLPALPLFFDLLENTSSLIMIRMLPEESITAAYICSVAGVLKWITISLCIFIVLLVVILRFINYRQKIKTINKH
ncbi:MAG: hypothetical protein R6U11_06720 [Bacteroidales bacterium]